MNQCAESDRHIRTYKFTKETQILFSCAFQLLWFSVLSEIVMSPVSKAPANSTRNSRSVERLLRKTSPSKMNLSKEKEELKRLNDRFAAYIEKVRTLEEENNRIKKNTR